MGRIQGCNLFLLRKELFFCGSPGLVISLSSAQKELLAVAKKGMRVA
jgi:hypothetical protein